MNKLFDFFNKIMGLIVFLIAAILLLFLFHHGHHGRNWHHSHFTNVTGNNDSLMKSYRDSVDKK